MFLLIIDEGIPAVSVSTSPKLNFSFIEVRSSSGKRGFFFGVVEGDI